jgi:phosphoglycolate phosphatase
LHRHLPERNGQVLPGVNSLVQRLTDHEHVAMGLLTGNVREGAKIKLEFFGLFHHFEFGGYGDHHPDRDDVAREALRSLDEFSKGRVNGDQIWVVGDTPADIRCARAINARAVAVATGGYSTDELRLADPDHLLDDLSDATELLDRLL